MGDSVMIVSFVLIILMLFALCVIVGAGVTELNRIATALEQIATRIGNSRL
jgi:ABC-type Na+ efflux pump permease subunit